MIFNVCGAPPSWPRALLHYMTSPFLDSRLARRYSHTNYWEIMEICRVLDRAGFQVDVVDRSERKWLPEDEYSVFISNASGNSGRRFPAYASRTPSALKIFYATGTEADLSKELMLARYSAFERRTGVTAKPMRVPHNVDTQANIAATDAVVCMDGNGFATRSYAKFNLPTSKVVPSTSPALRYDYAWHDSRDLASFLCFASNGFIVKGVDMVVEAFRKMPHLKLFIAGPDTDSGFWKAYGSIIESCPNISYEGFLDIRSKRFRELCSRCSFTILPSASEGACTSVATTMRTGLVPITTVNTGIDDGSAGYILSCDIDSLVDAIAQVASTISEMPRSDYFKKVASTRKVASIFTQAGYSASFSHGLHDVLQHLENRGED